MKITKAIVVEDTDADRELIVNLLRAAGIDRVTGYATLPDRFEPPLDAQTLVTVDLVLGQDADGIQVLQAIAALEVTDSPILLVSGQLQQMLEVVQKYGTALGLNIVAAVEKPLPVDIFTRLLDDLNRAD